MLVEMAVFDAFGAGFEYAPPAFIRAHGHRMVYMRHPKWKGPPGRYTDDTQMALALAELLLRKDPRTWTPYDVARAFVGVFKRDPRPGYSGMFYKLLQQMNTGWDFLKMVRPFSNKSGGAMRAPVIGLLPDIKQVAEVARFQASLTHCTRLGMDAAVASALMTHYFYYRLGPKADLPWFLDTKGLCFGFSKGWEGYVGSPGNEHVLAAMTAIVEHDSMEAVLKACVDFTGDVDTVAAIAGPAASFSDEIDQSLPAVLLDNLEDGNFGRDYLDGIDDKLLDRFPRPAQSSDEGEAEEAQDGPPVWHCTDCGQTVEFDEEPDVDFVNCPLCGGIDSVSRVVEPDPLISELFG